MLGPGDLVCSALPLAQVPFLDRLEPVREAGFQGISVSVGDYLGLRRDGLSPSAIRARIADAGLAVCDIECIGLWLRGHGCASSPWAQAMADLTPGNAIEAAAALGARGILVTEMLAAEASRDEIAEAFAAICEQAAASASAIVHLEAVAFGAVNDFAAARDVVERAGQPNGALTLDPWHFFRTGGTLADLAGTAGHLIGCIQLCDGPLAPDGDPLRETTTARLAPGEGEFDLAGLIAVLDGIGAAAPLSVEVFNRRNRDCHPAELARRWAQAARRVAGNRSLPAESGPAMRSRNGRGLLSMETKS